MTGYTFGRCVRCDRTIRVHLYRRTHPSYCPACFAVLEREADEAARRATDEADRQLGAPRIQRTL
jgi:uncharacterized paraquat-inducible protein A